jgi:hypothetical protein
VSTKDVFPPPPPVGVLVLTEEGGNRIVWNPVLASDLKGYRVYRLDAPGATWRKIGDDLKDPVFFDPGAPLGARYRVTAFDQAGNESAPGTEKP